MCVYVLPGVSYVVHQDGLNISERFHERLPVRGSPVPGV